MLLCVCDAQKSHCCVNASRDDVTLCHFEGSVIIVIIMMMMTEEEMIIYYY